MNRRYLLTHLALPLIALAAICMFVSVRAPEPWNGLLVNMAAAFIGAVLTVFFVDAVLRRYQDVVWKKVRDKVVERLEIFANAHISSVRQAFGVEPQMSILSHYYDLMFMRKEMIRLAEQALRPTGPGVARMDQPAWQTFAMNLQRGVQEADQIMILFSRNLDAGHTLLLLEIQKQASLLLIDYQTWKDVLGVPDHLLPPRKDGSSRIAFRQVLEDGVSANLEQLLAKCSELLHSLPPHSS